DEAQWIDFAAYLPLHPDTFFDLAEDVWFAEDDYPNAREWVADSISRWRDVPSVDALVMARCPRWLGFWHRNWHRYDGGRDPERLARELQAVNDNAARL